MVNSNLREAATASGSEYGLVRPSLDCQYAFDFCATELCRLQGRVAIVAGNPYYAHEMLRRLGGCLTVLLVDQPSTSQVQGDGAWSVMSTGWEHFGRGEGGADDETIAGVVWAEPHRGSARRTLERIHRVLLPGGRVYLVAPSWYAIRSLMRRTGRAFGEHTTAPGQLMRWLPQNGFAIDGLHGFGSPASIVWACTALLAGLTGREDLADRCHFKMRASYVVSGRWSLWARLVVIAATRGY